MASKNNSCTRNIPICVLLTVFFFFEKPFREAAAMPFGMRMKLSPPSQSSRCLVFFSSSMSQCNLKVVILWLTVVQQKSFNIILHVTKRHHNVSQCCNNGWQFTVHSLSNQFYKCWPYSQLITCSLNLSIILQECHQHPHFLYIQGSIFSLFHFLKIFTCLPHMYSPNFLSIHDNLISPQFICETNKEAEKYYFQLIIV